MITNRTCPIRNNQRLPREKMYTLSEKNLGEDRDYHHTIVESRAHVGKPQCHSIDWAYGSPHHRPLGFAASFDGLFLPKYWWRHFLDELIILPRSAIANVARGLFSKKSQDGMKQSSKSWAAVNVGSSADLLKKTCIRLTTLLKKSSSCLSVEGVTLRARLDATWLSTLSM